MSVPEKSAPATLRTVARDLGVSHVTVSLALRNYPKVSEARRLEIQAYAQRLGYLPNAIAVALAHRRRSTSVIPVRAGLAWLNQWEHPHRLRFYKEFDRYWTGAYTTAEKLGYRLEEYCCGGQMPLSRIEKILLARGVTGVLLPPHPAGVEWNGFHWERFSAMRFGRSVVLPRLHIVTSDQVANAIQAFRQVQRRGYRRIGFVTCLGPGSGVLFKAGFLMAQSDLPPARQLRVCVLDQSDASGMPRRLARWLDKARPDAILTDLTETRELLEKTGCRVPEDVGLAAMSILDGNADAGIDQHPEEIGRVAVLLVVSLINDHALGVPPIFRQVLVEGFWVDGSTLPDRSAG